MAYYYWNSKEKVKFIDVIGKGVKAVGGIVSVVLEGDLRLHAGTGVFFFEINNVVVNGFFLPIQVFDVVLDPLFIEKLFGF